ncbi:hypothetical protein C8Q80DRAFT_1100784 [Daedaleopsis nitida]|nr:hypothetical protein C8Q80DRAFT_1100784 [Daedaleopsis nitida]
MAFPEPQLYRSSSQRSQRSPYRATSTNFSHRTTRSESILTPDSLLTPTQFSISGESSRPPSFENTPESTIRDLSSELSDLTIDSEEGLNKFQRGELNDAESEWYRLVPPEAREVLERQEVQRQSILFEIIKTEKNYVSDLELIKEVFILPMMNTMPIPPTRVKAFIHEVFYNLDDILAHHQRMLAALYSRQRDQFPLVQSVADIILDNSLLFRPDYEEYIKHYPISEMRHRSEMRRNSKYQYFVQQCSLDPRVRKRDLITFISRPVTRLPRLQLLLENAKKYTEPDHPDMEAIPLILGILNEFIRSTQPGIEAAEEKVKFWSLCETLVYQKGEIIDLDLYDDTRSLRFQGPLSRRYRSEMNFHWADLHVALLDNYLLLLKPEVRSGGDWRANPVTKHHVVSRPIPLDYLRLGMFDASPENRKEKAEEGSLGLLDRVRPRYRPMYPFTIYHASAKMTRRYTLYASSESARDQWLAAFNYAIEMRRVRQEGNMFFAPQTINDGFFKHPTYTLTGVNNESRSHFTGQIYAATKFYSNSHKFIAVACSSGVFIAQKGEPAFRKVLNVYHPTCLVALPVVNKLFVLHEAGLSSYSLDLVGRAALGVTSTQNVEASREKIAADVLFFRAGRVGNRVVVLYAAKSFLQVYLYALEVVSNAEMNTNPRRSTNGLYSFRSFGEPVSISKDTHTVTALKQRIVVCSERGFSVVDPTNLSSSKSMSIPDFSDADLSNNLPMMTLKSRCAASRPLGIVRCDATDELLVIYDELGCYTDKYGVPSRSSGYLRWETKAAAYSWRGEHLLLFSPEFVEIRTVRTGKLVQVVEGEGIRRVDTGLISSERDATTIVAVRGREEQGLTVDTLQEFVETTEIRTTRPHEVPGMWDDFEVM